jgi:predicted ATP-dependent endonuclease of OLD family
MRLSKFGSLKLTPDGDNLPQVLETLYLRDRDAFDELEEVIKKLVPEVDGLKAYLEGGETSPMISERGLKSSFHLGEVGTGLQQLLILVLAIFVADEGSIICIEEPEVHHHTQTQRNFFNFLKNQSQTKQILLVTHSSVFVDRSETASTYLVRKNDGHASVHRVISRDFDDIVLELGLRKSDIFQADAFVLVEGESDKRILHSLCKTLKVDIDQMNIQIISVGGKDSMDFYANARVLHESAMPFKVILDSDGEKPDKIRKKLLGINRQGKRIKSSSEKRVARESDIIVLPEYSIESYLIVTRAISNAFGLDQDRVEMFLKKQRGKNKKAVLKELAKRLMKDKYREVADGENLASHLKKGEIDPYMRRIIQQRIPGLIKQKK